MEERSVLHRKSGHLGTHIARFQVVLRRSELPALQHFSTKNGQAIQGELKAASQSYLSLSLLSVSVSVAKISEAMFAAHSCITTCSLSLLTKRDRESISPSSEF